jgi:hypothetical protein
LRSFSTSPGSFTDRVNAHIDESLRREKNCSEDGDDECSWGERGSVGIVCDDLVQMVYEGGNPHYKVDDGEDEESSHLSFDAGTMVTE